MTGKILLFALIAIWLALHQCYEHKQFLHQFPTPFTKHNKVLGMILAFDLNHIDPLLLNLHEYVTMCEAGYLPTVIIYTGSTWGEALRRFVMRQLYCYRIDHFIDVRLSQHDPSIGIALGAVHRSTVRKEIDNYDVFIYHEDDILFQFTHLTAYLLEIKKLYQLDPENGLQSSTIGFQRYRHQLFQQGWLEEDILKQDLMEELPRFDPMCVNDTAPYLAVYRNTHQAMWILIKQQVLYLQEKCEFMNYSNPSREHMSSFSLFGEKCALNKLLPGGQFMKFTVLHYYHARHISWKPVFAATENILTGFHYSVVPKTKELYPPCWDKIIERSLMQLNETFFPNDNATVFQKVTEKNSILGSYVLTKDDKGATEVDS